MPYVLAGQRLTAALLSPGAWQTLGTLAGYTVNTARYRVNQLTNEVEFDITVTSAGANASSVNFSVTLPGAATPVGVNRNPAMGTTRAVTAGDVSPRLVVSVAGNVSVVQQASVSATLSICVAMPLD